MRGQLRSGGEHKGGETAHESSADAVQETVPETRDLTHISAEQH